MSDQEINGRRCVGCGAPGATPRSADPFTGKPANPPQLWHDHCHDWVKNLGEKSRNRRAGAAK